MKNNVINPCQELLVSNSAVTTTTTTTNNQVQITSKGATTSVDTQEQPQKVLPTDKYKESGDFHRVKSGESLNTIARAHGYTIDRFRWMNGLGLNEDIYPGQILRTSDCVCPGNKDLTVKSPQPYDAPEAYDDTSRIISGYAQNIADTTPKGSQIYVVRETDTLYSIARAFNTSVDNLMYLNNLSKGEIILPSQRLYVK